jgi:uncharacterized protein YdgA (DUF945 family)
MKKIFIAIVIFALLITGSYGFFGYMAKKDFDTAIEEIRSQIPSTIDVTYKQGFLSSSVELGIKTPIHDPDVNFGLNITTKHTIYHGPFIFHTIQGDHPSYIPVQAYTEGNLFYELTGDVDAEIAQGIKKATTTQINAYVPLFGNPTIHFSGKPLHKDLNMEGGIITVDWQGFTGSLEILGSIRDFTYNFIAPGLTIANKDDPVKIQLINMSSSGTAHRGNFDIGLGSYKAGLENIAIIMSEDPYDEIHANDIKLNIVADEKEGLLTISEIFDINSFSLKNKTYGPANSTVYLRNLDAKTLAAMNQEYIEMQKTNGNDPDAIQSQLMQMVSTHGAALLAKSPEFEFENLSLQSPEGKGEARLKISFNGEGDVIMNPLFLLGRLSAEASFAADEQFLTVLLTDLTKAAICTDNPDAACGQQAAEKSQEQLQTLLINKQLILDNSRYTAAIIYKDGAASLNGKPIPLF